MTIISLDCATVADLQPVAAPSNAGAAEMSTVDSDSVALEAPRRTTLLPARAAGRRPIRVHGKFFFAGETKHFVKGVTYGPFGRRQPRRAVPRDATIVEHDFALMRGAGVNTVRVFTVPPVWLLDAADEAGLKVLVGLPWSQHVAFLDSAAIQARDPRRDRRRGARLRAVIRRSSPISSATRSRPT